MKSPKNKTADQGVAVIIGALLLMVIIVSLSSTYLLWYIPANGAKQDTLYQGNELQSIVSLQEKMNNSDLLSAGLGEHVTQSFPLGISGSPPFQGPTSTSIIYDNSTQTYVSMLYGNYTLEVYNNSHTHSIIYPFDYVSIGTVSLVGNTAYVTSYSFVMQDSMVIEYSQTNNISMPITKFPLYMTGKSSSINLTTSIFNVTGTTESDSGYSSNIFTTELSALNSPSIYVNDNITISSPNGGYSAVVKKITLDNLNYSVYSDYIGAINYSLGQCYNNSIVPSFNVPNAVYNWQFSNYHEMHVIVKNSFLRLELDRELNLNSLSIFYLSFSIVTL